MFNPFPQENPDLTEAIAEAFVDLKDYDADDKEYATAVDQIVKLHALKKKSIDPNTMLIAGANLFIGLAVLKYEGTGVVTTKVWNFLSKL